MMNDSPAVHHVRISIYYVLWCDSGLPVRLAFLGRVLPLSTLSDLWADGHTFKKETWAKGIEQ